MYHSFWMRRCSGSLLTTDVADHPEFADLKTTKMVDGFPVTDEWLGARISSLPFTLTSVQQRSIQEIRADFDSGRPMNRLLQGDVGSGKTVVAALAAAMIVVDSLALSKMVSNDIVLPFILV